jgi:hypothetical protein
MEAKELLTRIRCKKDERIMWIALTEKGQQLQETIKDIPSRLKESIALTAEELETLRTLVNKLLNHK